LDHKEAEAYMKKVEHLCDTIETMAKNPQEGMEILFSTPDGHLGFAVEARLFELKWVLVEADRSGVYMSNGKATVRIFTPLHGWGPANVIEELRWSR